MMTAARTALGVRLARWHFRRVRDDVISFTEHLSKARTALLVLPPAGSPSQSLDTFARRLRDWIPDERITIVSVGRHPDASRLFPRSHCEPLFDADIDWTFRPRRPVLQRLRQTTFDLAIDCCLDFHLAPAYIVKASAARVRVGFTRTYADHFYNLLIHPDPLRTGGDILQRLADCLEMFSRGQDAAGQSRLGEMRRGGR